MLNKSLLPRCLTDTEALQIEDETAFYDQVLTYLKGGAIVAAKPISTAVPSKTGRGGSGKGGGGKSATGGGQKDAKDAAVPSSPLSKEAVKLLRSLEAKANRAMKANKPKADVDKIAQEMNEANGGPITSKQIGYKTWEATLTYEPDPEAAAKTKKKTTKRGSKRKDFIQSDNEDPDQDWGGSDGEDAPEDTIDLEAEDELTGPAPDRVPASHANAQVPRAPHGRMTLPPSRPVPPDPRDSHKRKLDEMAEELLPSLMTHLRDSHQFAQQGAASSQSATPPADPNLARFLALAEEQSKQAAQNAKNLERLTNLAEQQQKTIADQHATIGRWESNMVTFQNTAWQVISGQHQTLSQQTQHLGSLVGMASSCFKQLNVHHQRDARTVEFLTQGAICQAFGNKEAFSRLPKPLEMPESSPAPDAFASLDQAVASTAASQGPPPPAAASQIGGCESQQHTSAAAVGAASVASVGAAPPPAPAMPPTTMPQVAFPPSSLPPHPLPPSAMVNTGAGVLHGHISPPPSIMVQNPVPMGAPSQPSLFLAPTWASSSQAPPS